MEPVKMDVSVNVSIDLSQSTKDFFVGLFQEIAAPKLCPTVEAEVEKPVKKKPAKPAAPKPTPEPVEEKPVEEKPVEEKPAPKPIEEKPAVKEVSIEDVRKALAAKVNDHRAEIKDKLTEFGAPSVTKLDPAKYSEMLSFLTSL